MSLINLDDSVMDIMIKMSQGNPGAIQSLAELYKNNKTIDPDSMFGDVSAIMFLDTLEIYGSDIYILMNDKCDRDTRKMIMLLRAAQLGIIANSFVKQLSLDQMRKVNISEDQWQDIEDGVLDQLPAFKKAA